MPVDIELALARGVNRLCQNAMEIDETKSEDERQSHELDRMIGSAPTLQRDRIEDWEGSDESIVVQRRMLELHRRNKDLQSDLCMYPN